ncbi:radical SAM family heme chaperone HemW [Roseovarius salis]|uniref:radical SAM family heme chaperone HemW n=1 Tax=Roseovarius salis TaxID=3376063 RepID=UPI0037C6173D
MAEDWQNGGFGLYLHWPFCEAKCPYCDFNSHVAREIDQCRWKSAYLAEIARYAELLPGRILNSVFFGGGTPSLMSPELVSDILDAIRTAWPAANDLEVTLEANPGSVEAGRFAGYAAAGVSRVSMGVQALNDHDLRRLGRLHSVQEAYEAFDIARKYFDRVSFDLIYARQGQSVDEWRKELAEALKMAVDHLSLYQLTIEPGTAFGERHARGGLKGLPGEDKAGDMYEITQETCRAAGLEAYEVSNHAVPGAESRHNLIYWRYGDYVGIGPGAHGRITLQGQRHATVAPDQPDQWLAAVEAGRGAGAAEPIPPAVQGDEYLMMGLRISEGIDADRFQSITGATLDPEKIHHLQEIGVITVDDHRVRATESGRPVLNAVIRELLSS